MPFPLSEDQFHYLCLFLFVDDVLAASASCTKLNNLCRQCKRVESTKCKLRAMNMEKLISLFPMMSSITLNNAEKLNSAGCSSLWALGSQLSIVQLKGMRLIDDTPLAFSEHSNLKSLAVLELSGTFFTKRDVISSLRTAAPNLIALSLSGFRNLIDNDVFHLTRKLCFLETLCLSNCSSILNLKIENGTLKNLDVSQCVRLSSMNFITPLLSKLNCSMCTKLLDDTIHSTILSCRKLQYITLKGCSSLKNLSISSSYLLQLDLSGCRLLTSLDLYCPKLTNLSLDMCISLSLLLLCLDSIHSVNLSILPIKTLSLSCVTLTELNLRGNCRLIDNELDCHLPSLQHVNFCGTQLTNSMFKEVKRVESGGILLHWAL